MKRRYALIDYPTKLMISEHWTQWGALWTHQTLKKFLKPRNGKHGLALLDRKTGKETVLPYQ